MYVIFTNHVNLHRESLWSDREKTGNTGKLKMKFEWVPCLCVSCDLILINWSLFLPTFRNLVSVEEVDFLTISAKFEFLFFPFLPAVALKWCTLASSHIF